MEGGGESCKRICNNCTSGYCLNAIHLPHRMHVKTLYHLILSIGWLMSLYHFVIYLANCLDSDTFLSPSEESDDENTIEVEENIQFKVSCVFRI